MASFDDPSWPRQAAWSPAGGPGEPDDGFHDEPVAPRGPSGPQPPRPRHRRGNILWRWRRIFFLIGLLCMAMVAGGVAVMAQAELPELDDLQQTSFICTAEITENCNSEQAMARLSEEEDRENVRLDQLPDHVIEAVVAAEDRDFYEHTGINPMGIARALYRDVRAGGLEQGGSTITQQLVKNRYLTNERSLSRKLEEALLAIRVEQDMSKDQILEAYLNTIYLGRNAYGVGAASRAYFGREVRVEELNLGQAAYLAGLIRAPELADSTREPEEAKRRQQTVLDAMLEEGYISEEEHELWSEAPVEPPFVIERGQFRQTTTVWPDGDAKGAQYINDYVSGEASRILQNEGYSRQEARDLIANGGLRIYTTIDRTTQVQAYDAVYTNNLNQPGDPAGALVALDRQGRIRAMVGGSTGQGQDANFAVDGYGSGGRPVGSTFKPIALAEAVASNYSLTGSTLPAPGTTVIPSIPGCDAWEVSNYDEEDAPSGSFNLVEATQYSSNTAYGHLMAELTPERVKSMAADLGMDSELSDCLPTVLGADNSNPLEMAEVYNTFASQGMHREPSIISRIEQVTEGGDLEELYTWEVDEDQVLTSEQADLVTYALRQVVEGGTGQSANYGQPLAAKTGTTSSNRDSWMVGYTPGQNGLTTAVWMGFPDANWEDPECFARLDEERGPALDPVQQEERRVECTVIPPMTAASGHAVHGRDSVTGGSIPADIFRTFMETAQGGNTDTFTDPPPEVLRQGTRLGGDGGYDDGDGPAPSTTAPGGSGGPQPTGPSTSVTEPGGGTATTETTSTSTPGSTDTTGTSFTIVPPTSRPPPGNGDDD
jgi:membrane peptidoglycan carboxypeptidase